MSPKQSISLTEISKSDIKFLYNLLKERDPITNISHINMPTYTQHTKFVNSKPYYKWYVIKIANKKIGSAYITNLNEIAIHFIKSMLGKNLERLVLKLIMDKNPRNRYLANVNPSNKERINFLKKSGFKLIQHTYEFRL